MCRADLALCCARVRCARMHSFVYLRGTSSQPLFALLASAKTLESRPPAEVEYQPLFDGNSGIHSLECTAANLGTTKIGSVGVSD
jgi:hypothetical protein